MTDSKNSASQPTALPTAIPLIIGVTGHRDLVPEDLPRLKELVREVFQGLRVKHKDTPLVLLSPLVEGADQLVAEVALEQGVNAQLVAVLCWPVEFEPDKSPRGGSLTRFQELLSCADKVVSMPLDEDGRTLAASEWKVFAEQRYELVGKYIARHSQLLIAIWDGDEREASGTARVVKWQRSGAPAPFAIQLGQLDIVEGSPICHIVTRRTAKPAAASSNSTAPLSVRYLYPESAEHSAEEEINRVWSNIDRFNRDVADVRRHSPDRIATSRSWVLPVKPDDIASHLPRALRELFEFYALADSAALTFQNRIAPRVKSLFIAGPLALVCLEVYAHFWNHWLMLLGYLVTLGWGYWQFARTRRADLEGRYLDYRALAEALRVQFFWRWTGLTDCAADHYLRHLRGELGWVRQASRNCFLLTAGTRQHSSGSRDRQGVDSRVEATPLPDGRGSESHTFSITGMKPGSEESLNGVLKYWVEDQFEYFKKTAPKKEHQEQRCERIAKWSFRAALAIAAVELVYHLKTDHASHTLILLTFFGLVLATLVEEIAEYHTFGILARQYEWMKNLFATAQTKLTTHIANRDTKQAQSLLHEVGLEALNENADWLVQRRRKPVVLPK